MIYFISDLHLGHKNMLKFEKEYSFKTIEEHDNYFLEILEKRTKSDTVYILGDVLFKDLNGDTLNRLKNLKCKTILIKGNHDKREKQFYQIYFDEYYETPIYLTPKIVLSHYPIPVTEGTLNIHGHLHCGEVNKKNYLNVSRSLFAMDDALNILSTLPQDNMTFLEEWYAPLQKEWFKRDDLVLNEDMTIDIEKSKELRKNKWE